MARPRHDFINGSERKDSPGSLSKCRRGGKWKLGTPAKSAYRTTETSQTIKETIKIVPTNAYPNMLLAPLEPPLAEISVLGLPFARKPSPPAPSCQQSQRAT